MSNGINKEIVLHCLKSASDFHDEICEECPMYSKCDHTWKSKVYERALELIENQWIPVKERAPLFAGCAVLAILENAYGQRKVEKIFTGYGYGKRWYCNNKCIDMEKWKVIAWMPLPLSLIHISEPTRH